MKVFSGEFYASAPVTGIREERLPPSCLLGYGRQVSKVNQTPGSNSPSFSRPRWHRMTGTTMPNCVRYSTQRSLDPHPLPHQGLVASKRREEGDRGPR